MQRRRQSPPPRQACPTCGKKAMTRLDVRAAMIETIYRVAYRCRSCGAIDGLRVE